MARTQARIGLIAETLLSASSDRTRSLQGITVAGLIEGTTCFVDENGQVYEYLPSDTNVADAPRLYKPTVGAGSWALRSGGVDGQTPPEPVIEVRSLADLPAPTAAVITLAENRRYVFVGVVDIGVNRITCAIGVRVYGRQGGQIVCNNAGAAFTGPDDNFVMEDMTLVNATGLGFAWAPAGAEQLQLSRCSFRGGAGANGMTLSPGGSGTDVGLHQIESAGGSGGRSLQFAGDFDDIMINDCKFWTVVGDGIVFVTGASAVRCCLNGSIVNAGAVGKSGIDVVDAAGVTDGRINGCIFEGAGTLLGVSGNIPGTEWEYRGNVGFADV